MSDFKWATGTSERAQQSTKYTGEMFGSAGDGVVADFPTVREIRDWAESYGNTMDLCVGYNGAGKIVALWRRDTTGDGRRWFRANRGD